jgi:hypothetical protein
MELTQDRVHWRVLVLAVLNLCVLLPELLGKVDHREIGCENGRWMELVQDRVVWRVLVLAVLNLCVLLQELVNWQSGS